MARHKREWNEGGDNLFSEAKFSSNGCYKPAVRRGDIAKGKDIER